MPAEWEKQEAVWLSWPHNRADWPGKFGPIPWAFAEMIRHIARHQRVTVVVKDDKAWDEAVRSLAAANADLTRVDFVILPTNRGWLRDCGPIFVRRGKQTVALDWRFNAWAKYRNWQKDDAVPAAASTHLGMERIEPVWPDGKRIVLEGGSIDVNGAGTILTTEECLLSNIQCRNPGRSREEYEAAFAQWLGAHHTIWLGDGIVGDDTHGHVDDLARFVNETTVVTAVESDKKDDNYARLRDNLERLKEATDQDGKPLTVVELPMPKPVTFDGQRLPASYANFLIVNGAVLVPVFNDANDRHALNILADCFPDREIIGLAATDLVWGLGTIHCLTQQQPS